MRAFPRGQFCLASILLASCGGGGSGDGGGGGAGTPPIDVAAALAADASVTPLATYEYAVTVTASGGNAQAVTATLTLPATLTVNSISDGGSATGDAITWPTTATLAPGTPLSYTVNVTAPSVGPLDATLAVATTSTESNGANNTATRRTVLGFDALATLTGEAAGDLFGFVADGVGDITGDGVVDFIVGAPFNDGGGSDAGRAYVYSGADAELLFTVSGQAAGENLGWSVAAAGDVDGDGTGDFIAGGPASGPGVARVYSGSSGSVLHVLTGPGAGSRFGVIVSGIGDVDGDGRADLLIGAESAAGGSGQAFVVSGMAGATLRTHTGTTGTLYGYGLGPLGDVSADGVPDYAIGGGRGVGGLVEARSGADGSLLYTVNAVATSGQLGFGWVDAVGDVNGDARPDFFAADINDSSNRGRGHLISGADGTTIRTIGGEQGGDFFGIARHGGHDVDGDGMPDLFVAGYHNGEGATSGGKAYVFSGATGSLLRTMTSLIGNETLGYDAVQLGDVDGDALVDYLLTGDQESGTRGVLYVVRGTPLP